MIVRPAKTRIRLKNDTSATFVYQFLRIGIISRCPGCGVGTILRYHYFVLVAEITTRDWAHSEDSDQTGRMPRLI